ncbi:uncharacterized protein V6R79_020746 [Siganus canaliculatus]
MLAGPGDPPTITTFRVQSDPDPDWTPEVLVLQRAQVENCESGSGTQFKTGLKVAQWCHSCEASASGLVQTGPSCDPDSSDPFLVQQKESTAESWRPVWSGPGSGPGPGPAPAPAPAPGPGPGPGSEL